MISWFLYYFLGYVRFTVPKICASSAADVLFKNNVRYRNLKYYQADAIIFKVLCPTANKVKSVFRGGGISFSESKVCGFPSLISAYGRRYGMILGVLVFAFVSFISQKYVWYIDVIGCENVTPESVVENLSELGFTYGTNFKKIDFDYLRNTYLKTYDDLCWISINMQGTYAHVEVRELKDPPKTETEGCTNIIAAEDGEIILVESFEGEPVVFPGDHVSKGELLISGVMTSGEDSLRYERADGRVLALVERRFKVEFPKNKDIKFYNGEEIRDLSLIFFKKCVKVSGKCRISDVEYDTIILKEQLSLFDFAALPIFIEWKIHRPYTVSSIPMERDEITDNVKRLTAERISEITKDAELIETEVFQYEGDGSVIVIGKVQCIADIGQQTEVSISDK